MSHRPQPAHADPRAHQKQSFRLILQPIDLFWSVHRPFLLLLVLFAAFRLFSLFLFRPGGFITDFSDYDFYYEWGVLPPMGYFAFENLWTAYPPLFPALMLTIFEWSSRIPPWVEPRLFFHLLFGAAMLIFECGNFICIYWLGRRLALDEIAPTTAPAMPPGLWPAILYGFLFTPVYTMLGWFEPMPLFFMLLGLCLLLAKGPWWWLSAIAAGLGFLSKLTPILLLPIAVRWLGAKLSLHAARREWFRSGTPNHDPNDKPGNLLRPIIYIGLFAAIVVGVGYPLVSYNLELAFASFQVQNIRPPWQSIWALIDGYYGWGLVPLSMRNLEGLSGPLWESDIPWTWISLAFVLLYLYFYTRAYNWHRIRTPLAFAGFSVTLLFLYSKGWSPQFLIWTLVFIVLLTPSPRWILAAVTLGAINLVESSLYVIMLPQETYLLVGTVLLRTVLLVLFCAELLLQIWPHTTPAASTVPESERPSSPFFRSALFQRTVAGGVWLTLLVAVVAGAMAYPRAATAYQAQRLAEHSCRASVLHLQDETAWPNRTLVTQQPDIWREFYPWLHRDYEMIIVDGYDTQDRFVETALTRLDTQLYEAQQPTTPTFHSSSMQELWWLERHDLEFPGSSPAQVWDAFIAQNDVYLLEEHNSPPCILRRVVDLDSQAPLAQTQTTGQIQLRAYVAQFEQSDEIAGNLRLVLYWQAAAPIEESFTVFVHVFDSAGVRIGQQDNLPVQGLAPTDHWTPGQPVRDPYAIELDPATNATGQPATLHVGLYTEEGRILLEQADGTIRDYIEINLNP